MMSFNRHTKEIAARGGRGGGEMAKADMSEDGPGKPGWPARIGKVTAIVLAIAGFLEAADTLINRLQNEAPLTCSIWPRSWPHLPWCLIDCAQNPNDCL